ncbi:MAG TPA: DUF4214 domain-containing protein [Acidimicrobiales bacterium]|nr:DUF4214 domain-containing protein [Acidimicrobiales bacterium]
MLLACGLAVADLAGPAAAVSLARAQEVTDRAVTREDTYVTSVPTDVQRMVVTPDFLDGYALQLGRRTVRAFAPAANVSGNLRMVWWPARAPASVDSEACSTWARWQTAVGQPGIALRARRDGARERVITVTNNILFAGRWGWNTHLWEKGRPARLIGSVTLHEVFGSRPQDVPPLPWRLCARAVGATVQFKAWPLSAGATEPAWGDARYGSSVVVPPDWVFPGRSGWYIGHLAPGEWFDGTELGSWALRETRGDTYGRAMEAWAEGLYPLLFGRPSDGGHGYWADQAMGRGVEWAVAAMGTTPEARARTVTDVYQQVLHRAPDAGGLAYWTERLRTRPDVEALILAVVMEGEFSGARDDRAFVTDLYDRILGRPAEPAGVDHWVGQLARGVARVRVASLFVRSPENRVSTVRQVHQEVVGRPPTESELAWWGERFRALGLNRLRLRSALAASLAPRPPAT